MDFAAGFNIFQEIGPNYLGGMLYGEGRTAIHFTHRMGAVVTLLITLLLAWRLYRAGLTATAAGLTLVLLTQVGLGDRKSTRLNSSHVRISYAVFCLKK